MCGPNFKLVRYTLVVWNGTPGSGLGTDCSDLRCTGSGATGLRALDMQESMGVGVTA